MVVCALSPDPSIQTLTYVLTADHLTIRCYTWDTPPTEVIWEKDGERIPNNSSIYKFRQEIDSRYYSDYLNFLSITASVNDVMGEYTCTVINKRSNDSGTVLVKG